MSVVIKCRLMCDTMTRHSTHLSSIAYFIDATILWLLLLLNKQRLPFRSHITCLICQMKFMDRLRSDCFFFFAAILLIRIYFFDHIEWIRICIDCEPNCEHDTNKWINVATTAQIPTHRSMKWHRRQRRTVQVGTVWIRSDLIKLIWMLHTLRSIKILVVFVSFASTYVSYSPSSCHLSLWKKKNWSKIFFVLLFFAFGIDTSENLTPVSRNDKKKPSELWKRQQ